jgi:hypothetical protein
MQFAPFSHLLENEANLQLEADLAELPVVPVAQLGLMVGSMLCDTARHGLVFLYTI